MKARTKWEVAAADLIRAELEARGLNLNDLAKRLTEAGTEISHNAVRLKIVRGRFSAAFLLLCLDVIGSEKLTALQSPVAELTAS